MVARFVAGESLDHAIGVLERLRDRGFATTVDILGESVDATEVARGAVDRYLETLDMLAAHGLDRNVSLKPSQMGLDVDEVCLANVRCVVERAAGLDAFVRLDMEDHTTIDRTLALWHNIRSDPAGRGPGHGGRHCGVVIQAAIRRSPADVAALMDAGARIRLCKGAYREPASVAHQSPADVDEAYRQLIVPLLERGNLPAFATHDPAMIREVIVLARAKGIEPRRFEFQMLYGVRRNLQEELLAADTGCVSTFHSAATGIRTSCADSLSVPRMSLS